MADINFHRICAAPGKLMFPHLRFPYAYFRLTGADADKRLGQEVEELLRQRFEVERIRPNFGKWIAMETIDRKQFGVIIGRKRRSTEGDVYNLQVSDWNGSFWRWSRGLHLGDNISELRLICLEIQGLLSTTPLVSEVYGWYFRGFTGYTIPVATPDELPWSQLAPSA
jgi:hypothetical protein